MIDCHTKICTSQAVCAVYRPSTNGPFPMCADCAVRADRIAEAMGFKVPIGSLEPLIEQAAQQVEEVLQPKWHYIAADNVPICGASPRDTSGTNILDTVDCSECLVLLEEADQ